MMIKVIGEWDYSQVDDRVFSHDGCVVDLGCATWDFSKAFIGKKRVIGADPFEKPISGTEFFKGAVCATTGTAEISNDGQNSSTILENRACVGVPSLSWRSFCHRFSIQSVSLLKINIEGGEYPLLLSMDEDDFKLIDQIAVSFHDFLFPAKRKSTMICVAYLKVLGYNVTRTAEWGWYLAIKA